MESRLPKKKFRSSKKSADVIDSESISEIPNNVTNSLSKPRKLLSGSLRLTAKSKSTLNLKANEFKENEPPPKPSLRRSQSSTSLVANGRPKLAVKRLQSAKIEIEGRLVNVKQKAKVTQGNAKTGIPATTITKANGNSTVSGLSIVQKPSKWDLRGRLDLCNAEVASVKKKLAECFHLEAILEELRSKEASAEEKLENLETATERLNRELEIIKTDYKDAQQNKEQLEFQFRESQDCLTATSEALREREETIESQEKIINSDVTKIAMLEKNLNKGKRENAEFNEKIKDLQSLIHTMDKERRTLHNSIQELKGNIRVFCRVRPQIPKESSKRLCSIKFIDECTLEIGSADSSDALYGAGKPRAAKQEFSFDKIFPPTATQAEVFEELSLLVQSALEGYNVCVFAYGQTGSGKTYTMEGIQGTEEEGMIPRTVRHIFQEMKQFQLLGWEYTIEASFLEIYNEHIVDLLDSQPKNHEIRMAYSKGQDLYVTNVLVTEIKNPEELHVCLETARQNRAVAATYANERSSRSHSITRIRLIGVHTDNEEQSVGNLNLVDLAGSERLKSDQTIRTTETKNINKSLANLGNVILALLKKQDHIPYRNSKLTHLLMPSLGGNSKTLMLLNVSPLDECYNETLNSLRFASNVNSCKTGNVKRARTMINNVA